MIATEKGELFRGEGTRPTIFNERGFLTDDPRAAVLYACNEIGIALDMMSFDSGLMQPRGDRCRAPEGENANDNEPGPKYCAGVGAGMAEQNLREYVWAMVRLSRTFIEAFDTLEFYSVALKLLRRPRFFVYWRRMLQMLRKLTRADRPHEVVCPFVAPATDFFRGFGVFATTPFGEIVDERPLVDPLQYRNYPELEGHIAMVAANIVAHCPEAYEQIAGSPFGELLRGYLQEVPGRDDDYRAQKRQLTYTLQRQLKSERKRRMFKVVGAVDLLVSSMVIGIEPPSTEVISAIIVYPCEGLVGLVLGVLHFWVARPWLPGVPSFVGGCVVPLLPLILQVGAAQPSAWDVTRDLAKQGPAEMLPHLVAMVAVAGWGEPAWHETLCLLCSAPGGVDQVLWHPGIEEAVQPVEDVPFGVLCARMSWLLPCLEERPGRVLQLLPDFAIELADFWRLGQQDPSPESVRCLRGAVLALRGRATPEEEEAILSGVEAVVEVVAAVLARG